MKWSLIFADRLGPEILTMLEIKGQVLHLVRVHLKVPGWLSDFKALLTRKLPMLSFGIIAKNFEVFENYIFDCKVLWMVDPETQHIDPEIPKLNTSFLYHHLFHSNATKT